MWVRFSNAYLGGFLNSMTEWHAVVIGFGDGVVFTKLMEWQTMEIRREPHYYKAGLGLGRLVFFFVVALLVKWVQGGLGCH